MEIISVARIKGGQDGAIFNGLLFRFDHAGTGRVYDMEEIRKAKGEEVKELSTFVLDRENGPIPHSNSVSFGAEYYEAGDEFPLLYTNIYNNYAGKEDPMKGVTLVYRIWRTESGFASRLVQKIEIGFTEDMIWRSSMEKEDVRPYGNFAIDPIKGIYYAFVMRDRDEITRYFSFDLPKVHDGRADDNGVKTVVLTTKDILTQFDAPYHRFVQGAIFHEGKIYSVEGFDNDKINVPALRIIDVEKEMEEAYVDFPSLGCQHEAEMVDFYEGCLYYSDCPGHLYLLDFEE